MQQLNGNRPPVGRSPRSAGSKATPAEKKDPNNRIKRPAQTAARKKGQGNGSRLSPNAFLALILGVLVILFIVILVARGSGDDVRADRPSTAGRDGAAAEGPVSPEAEAEGPENAGAKKPQNVLSLYRDSATLAFDPKIDSKYGLIVERSTGRIVAQRSPEARVYPASLTKIMSLIVAVENCGSLDDNITFDHEIIYPVYRQGASMAGFADGETVPLRDMLYGMILPSGADAAEGICRVVAGDDEHFVELMNRKVKEMGLKNTHFANATGLHDPDQYSTCSELAVILDYALKDPTCRKVLSTYKYTTSPTDKHPEGLELTSDLQARMEGGESGVAHILGGKTGYVNESKYCLASFASADSDGEEYIIVTCMGSTRWKPIFDHINICKKYIGGLTIE